ncbi:MAG: hypothetical protein A2202_04790 [Bdellovibrionales bacterium RIFOXYA1_FULL_36_14]|nr:MAG: hypothetical protein A2202_04790 [Bdellovibrionales bacterium RIFOXYA1_FULL_36_14]
MKDSQIVFSADDFQDFRKWLNLNMESITWQNRFFSVFEEFWNLFFIDGLSIVQVNQRFLYVFHEIHLAPLVNWFKWLNEKFIIYTFIFKDASVWQISCGMDIHITRVALILRDFFVETNPHIDDFFNNIFHITCVTNPGLKLTFVELSKLRQIENFNHGSLEFEIMPSMEITLYDEFKEFLIKMKKDLYHYEIDLKKLEANTSWKKYGLFLLEAGALVIVGLAIIGFILKLNQWQQDNIGKKISIYKLQIPWISETYKPPEDVSLAKQELNPAVKNLKNVQLIDQRPEVEREIKGSSQFITESDVLLTSWDTLPKNFGLAELEMSNYEEESKGGFRDSQFGNKTVYRVIVNSVESQKTRSAINILLDKYKVTQADNVKPGTFVPGGVYYNLFVPTELLKEFLMKVDEVGDVVIYESNARVKNPPGKNKVFVWIKSF